VTLKAFFQDVDILHLCGPMARHYFREGRQIPYSAPWESVWRNHALVARVCFDDKTWYEHWLPNVFYKHLSPEAKRDLESAEVVAEHEAFLAQKVRPDREFWRGLLQVEEPACVRVYGGGVRGDGVTKVWEDFDARKGWKFNLREIDE
jgi:hypothetical protein